MKQLDLLRACDSSKGIGDAKPETRDEIVERIRLGEDSSFEMKPIQFAGERVSGLTLVV